ncbi:MAG TPA: nucleotidyltransferase, partial [Pyrinomonadaceae bacterium]|nr:nucleotidyltransferase [Pyrinomonadaceae bacterium]
MIDLIEEAERLQDFLESRGRNFYFIGGITVQVWGQPRLTQDIDLTVFTELENEAEFVAEMVGHYKPKFPSPTEFAITERILPLYSKEGIGIDLNLGGLSDTSSALARSSYQDFLGNIKLRILSAEDLLIAKTSAARDR